MSGKSIDYLRVAAQAIFDKKGANLLAFDLRDVSSLTDYVLIAEGGVERHVIALADEVIKTLKDQGQRPESVEGRSSGDWIVIDYLDYMIHIFVPKLRDQYRLEEIFKDGKAVDLSLDRRL